MAELPPIGDLKEIQLLETNYSEGRTFRRFRNCGMLSPYIDDFSGYLEEKGFSHHTARAYLRAARRLSVFALHEGKADIGGMTPELVGRFVNEHLPACTCERMNGGIFSETVAAMSYLVDFLSARGCANLIRGSVPAPPSPCASRASMRRRGAGNMALVLCRVCANRPLVPPPKDALFTAAEKAKEAASVAKRGDEAAAQITVGKGWEPAQLPKLLTKNASIPLARRS